MSRKEESTKDLNRVCEVCGKPLDYAHKKHCSTKCQQRARSTLCWECKNYHCSWLASETPVKGWKAIPKELKCQGEVRRSYIVVKCPKFMGRKGK